LIDLEMAKPVQNRALFFSKKKHPSQSKIDSNKLTFKRKKVNIAVTFKIRFQKYD